eukprot:g14818.t1
MFRTARAGRETLLPHSGNGRGGGGGLYGTARMTPKASLSKSFIATMIWALVSLSLIGGGWLYCSKKMQYTSIKCNNTHCDVEELSEGVTSVLKIPHSRMVRAELVRVKNGEVVDPAKLRRSAQRKLGHTYSLVYLEPDSEDDDDESYDSFEDDDDSYDSYDDDEASSEDDDDDALPGPAAARAKKTPPKPMPNSVEAARARDLAMEKKEAQRKKWAEERVRQGLDPIREPDEQALARANANARGRRTGEAEEERFPGDAGTMLEKNREEIRKMEAAAGMTAEGHRERSQRAYEEASKRAQSKHQMDARMKQVGNNLHDRPVKPKPNKDANSKPSPQDPDNKPRPKLERQKAEQDLSVDGGEDQNGQQGGGRKISSVGGQEDVDENEAQRRRLSSRERNSQVNEGTQDAEEGGFETLGELVQAGATGAKRKLMAWKNRVKKVDPPAAKRTKKEVQEDAQKARNSHRKGHGHHQKRGKKAAHPVKSDEDGIIIEENPKTKHHHKAFHHKKDVPMKDRHHVHPGFHHQPGEKKIEHGWRHQNRQWHGHKELKKLGTTFSLGRSTARKRKETIDSYVSRRTTSVDFTDSKKWRAGGLWMIILGCISAAFCLVIGNFQPRPKTKKVS